MATKQVTETSTSIILTCLAWTYSVRADDQISYVECEKGKLCATSFTYTVTNSLIWPFFNNSMAMKIKEGKPMVYYMQKAVDNDYTEYRFTATYYKTYGYFIEAMNGLYANWKDNRTYWEFSNATTSLSVARRVYNNRNVTQMYDKSPGSYDMGSVRGKGVSYYMPSPGDQVLLNFTVDASRPTQLRLTNGRL